MTIQGQTVPREACTEIPSPTNGDHLEAVKHLIRICSDEPDSRAAATELLAIRNGLAECLQLAEDAMARLTERLELQDSLVPDTDPIRHVLGAVARRMPEVDTSLSCDPDDRPNG